MSDAMPLDGPVRMGRFEWEKLVVCCPDSVLADEDKFRLLLLATTMDGKTGVARPGASGLATMAFHEETWKKTLRRMRDAGWLVQLERGGSRKGPGGTRINRTSVDQASVPVEVYARREEILKGTPHQRRESSALPSCEGPSTKEVSPTYEGSAQGLPSTPEREATKEASTSTKEASGTYEGSAQGLPLHGSSSSSTSSLSVPERADIDAVARKGEREDLYEDEQQEPVHNADPFTARLMAEYAATADEVAAVLVGAVRDGIKSPAAWMSKDAGRHDFPRRLAEHRARSVSAAARVARRSTCVHSGAEDPDHKGECLLCNIRRARATKPEPQVLAPEPTQDDEDDAARARMAEMIAKGRADRELRERQKAAQTGRRHESPRLDEAAEALREEWLARDGVPPVRVAEPEERRTA